MALSLQRGETCGLDATGFGGTCVPVATRLSSVGWSCT